MTTQDHNKTLAIIYTIVGWLLSAPVLLAPPIVYLNLSPPGSRNRAEQILITAIACAIFFALAVPFHVAAAGFRRRRRWVRRLAFMLFPVLLFIAPPAIRYVWWFFHSEGGKQIYGEGGTEPAAPHGEP
jgi:Na+-driven multidrug efflux pump